MRVCTRCGYTNNNQEMFCKGCGMQLKEDLHNSIDVIKKCGSSPLFLITILLYTLRIIVRIVSEFFINGVDFNYQIANFLQEFGLGEYNYSYYQYGYIGAIIGLIPTILICIGLWMFYFSCINKREKKMSTAGLTMIKTIQIIYLVFVSILFAIVVISFVILLLTTSSLNYSLDNFSSISTIGMIGIAIVIAICVLVFIIWIIYIAKIIKTLNVVKATAKYGTPALGISSFVAVINIILAVIVIASEIFLLYQQIRYGFYPNIWFSIPTINTLLTVLILIMIAIVIFSSKQKILQSTFFTQQPSYTSTNINPAPLQAPNATNVILQQPEDIEAEMKTCINCGGAVKSGDNFCYYCGHKQ